MPQKISPETRAAILDAAWDLMASQGRLDAGVGEIAAAAGVSRQTLFYAFGNRAGLLVAMARHQDAKSNHVERMRAIVVGESADVATLHAFVDAWLDYLPEVYPVAMQLETNSLSDPDVALAWQDRFLGEGLRFGLERILERMSASGALAPDHHPGRLADLCLALLVPSAWRILVIECGWRVEDFVASRRGLLDALLERPDLTRDKAPRSSPGNA